MTHPARRFWIYIAARAGVSWSPLIAMAVIAWAWAGAKNALSESGQTLPAGDVFELVCVFYVERAFIIFMAISLGVLVQYWWESQALADEEKASASNFWSAVGMKARWSLAISVLNIGIGIYGARLAIGRPSVLAALFWIASIITLAAAAAALRCSSKIRRGLPMRGNA